MRRTTIRSFKEGQDEDIWIELVNIYYTRYHGEEYEPMDRDDIEWFENTPWWRNTNPLIAEISDRPVGIIVPRLDKAYSPPKGFIWTFAVRPEIEGSEVERALLEQAISWLSQKGAKEVQTTARDTMKKRILLYKSKGFKPIRSFSIMRLKKEEVPSSVQLNPYVKLRRAYPLKKEEDLKVLNDIYNDAFLEHFNFRPTSPEEMRAWFKHEKYENFVLLAILEDRPIGFIRASVSRGIHELKFKRGYIFLICVLKPYRRKAIGTTLMIEGIKWLLSKGVEVIELGVDDENPTGAKRLYEKLGFKTVYKSLTFLKRL
ncbi:MAG: hypothetical protein DRN53_06890 [Thermoprotei archaeon]|nr:MAG: hypothetical protein DRN53_06890 [Thermoprotei archaeon]